MPALPPLVPRGHHISRNRDLPGDFTQFDQLRRPGLGVRLQPAALGPRVRLIVMTGEAQQQAPRVRWTISRRSRLARTDQKFLKSRPVELVELMPGICGVHLELERGRLHQLLLVAREAGQAVGEGVGDAQKFISAALLSPTTVQ